MGEVIQLQGDQRKDVQEFLVDKKEGLELDAKTIKVGLPPSTNCAVFVSCFVIGPWVLNRLHQASPDRYERIDRSSFDNQNTFTSCCLRMSTIGQETAGSWGVG